MNSLVVRLVTALSASEKERGQGVVVPAGISFHLIGRDLHPWQHGPVILTSHKPGTSLQGGVAPDVTGTTLPSLFSFWDDPLLTKESSHRMS
ncbi:hypothetical protein DPMN_086860 [Dreissena polymorpha]|uniref:Uncharacterized protein n=1 Tax=Dreissena polymorpha TaxID=45954 RepID=A0A9D4KT35_DREPO|nr:hypothetical protein DPMN_086860 [Dreissena polymorpha]